MDSGNSELWCYQEAEMANDEARRVACPLVWEFHVGGYAMTLGLSF